MNPHAIRLRRPWHCESTEGGLVWRRRFGRPTGLTPGQRVELVIDGLPPAASIALNGQLLPDRREEELGRSRFDVTGCLLARNELAIRLPLPQAHPPSSPGTPPVQVVLEIVPG